MPIDTKMPDVPVAPPTQAQLDAAIEKARRDRRDAAAMHRGETHDVSFMPPEDGSPARPAETVKVRLLPVTLYSEFYSRQHDEAAIIALCCERPPEWVADLTPDSHARLADSALAINFPWVIAWASRRGAVTEGVLKIS